VIPDLFLAARDSSSRRSGADIRLGDAEPIECLLIDSSLSSVVQLFEEILVSADGGLSSYLA
jgi:hypothetical protein